jgi:DGQHR domain-containing protein
MKVKAFDLSRNEIGFYLTAIDADILFNLSRVDRVSENPTEGFQRVLETPRARKIAKYHESKVIPGAIILSSQNDGDVRFDSASEELEIVDKPGALLVIDGQHRLYGAYMAYQAGQNNLKLSACILTNLTLGDQVQYFVDVNSTQKGVPRTLQIELTKFLVKEDSIDAIRLKLFKDLNSEEDSVLCGKLSAEQKGPGYLSHVPFESSINRILNSDRVQNLTYEKKKLLIKNYLAGVYDNLLESNLGVKLTQSAFFQAIFRVFDKACDDALSYKKSYKKESFVDIFLALQRINFDYHTGTNDEAITRLEKDILDKLAVQRSTRDDEALFS